MKKKFLSLVVAVAMLFSIVTFVVQADTDGEGDYFYFDIEHFAEDGTKEIYMTPIKIYTNGFYDYSGEFKTFDNSFESAADAIVYVLDYYMNNEECMSDWSPANTLLKYSYVDGMFRDFEFETSSGTLSFDYPSALYNDAMGNGLGSYTYESGSLGSGDVVRLVFNEGDWSSDLTSPAEDVLVAAVADYYETLATDPKTAKKAESAYQAALEKFFDENVQTELEDNLIDALVPSEEPEETPTATPTATATATPTATPMATAEPTVTPTVTSTPLPVQSATEQNTLKVENGKLTGTLTVKLNSNLTEEKKVSVMAAVYDSNGKLIGIQPKEISLKSGNENQVEFKEISADSADEYTIKILTWNGNISSLAPISNTLDLSIK